MPTYRLTWKEIHRYKKPGIKKRLERHIEQFCDFPTMASALHALQNALAIQKKLKPEHRSSREKRPQVNPCYDFAINGTPHEQLIGTAA